MYLNVKMIMFKWTDRFLDQNYIVSTFSTFYILPDCIRNHHAYFQGVLNQKQMEILTNKELMEKYRTFRLNTGYLFLNKPRASAWHNTQRICSAFVVGKVMSAMLGPNCVRAKEVKIVPTAEMSDERH